MQIESLEASAFYKVCISKYRTSILQKCCSSTRNDESDENDGRWIMCVPQSRSLGRRITRDDVGTLKRRFLPFFYKNVSKSLYLFISLISCFDMCYKRCVLTFTCMDSDISASGDLVLLERVESSVDVLPR